MPEYRRNRIPGGTYAFTVNLRDRRSNLLVEQIHILRSAVRATKAQHPFNIDAWVVLPDHLHCIWTLPDGDTDYPTRWKLIKGAFSRSQPPVTNLPPSLMRKGERGIWQRRYREHTIRDDRNYASHMDYIHFNPVKHGLVSHPAAWPLSTFRRCVAQGIYAEDWAGDGDNPASFGEQA